MNFDFSEEQTMLRDTLVTYLAKNYTFEQRRAMLQNENGFDPAVWRSFADDLGILGAPFPEAVGGFGGAAIENLVVMEELGKALALEPWIESVVMAGALLDGEDQQANELLKAIVAGQAIVIPALPVPGTAPLSQCSVTAQQTTNGYALSGTVSLVRNAVRASHFLVAATVAGTSGPTLFVLPASTPGLSRRDYGMVDGSSCADLTLEKVNVSPRAVIGEIGQAAPRIAEANDQGTYALCAESLGIQRRLLEWTVDYARQRKQFGRPIAEFQVLQHRMAEMYIMVEQTASMTIMLTGHMTDTPEMRAKHVAAAKVLIDQAGRFVGEAAVQIHGGMGMTKELPIADYFSRLVGISSQLGSIEYHFRRYEAASFGGLGLDCECHRARTLK